MIVGNNLIIENEKLDAQGTPTGVMQFKVDSSGAWLNNSTMVIQGDGTSGILMHPEYGIVAGKCGSSLTEDFITVNGSTVTPSFIDENGKMITDKETGMPKNSNFYLDSTTGDAYFKGTIYAEDGIFNGKVYANDGEFKGTVQAKSYLDENGAPMLNDDYQFTGEYLSLKGIEVKRGNKTTFSVDGSGYVNISGTVIMDEDSSLLWEYIDDSPSYLQSTYIDETAILSPTIVGGQFHATGKGADYGAAYYIRNGGTYNTSTGEVIGGTRVGYISYDTNGSGDSDKENVIEAKNRVFFKTEADTALKIESAANMSLEAKQHIDSNGNRQPGTIYLNSNVSFMSGKEVDFTGVNVKGIIAKFG